jgi:ACS family sodium-dependent inorganic phosphate cotransporter-like MFS transporter 9
VNMVPWLFCIPSTFLGKWLSENLITQGHSVTTTRKIIEVICLGSQALGLLLIGKRLVIGFYSFTQISVRLYCPEN